MQSCQDPPEVLSGQQRQRVGRSRCCGQPGKKAMLRAMNFLTLQHNSTPGRLIQIGQPSFCRDQQHDVKGRVFPPQSLSCKGEHICMRAFRILPAVALPESHIKDGRHHASHTTLQDDGRTQEGKYAAAPPSGKAVCYPCLQP